MFVYQTTVTETSTLVDVICDVCKQSCIDNEGINLEYATLCADWGYGSGKDGTSWLCHICSKCADLIHDFIESKGGDIVVSYH